MNRRTFLATASTLAAGLAGCSGEAPDSAEQAQSTPANTPTATPTSTPTPQGPPRHKIGEAFTVGTGKKSIQYRVSEAFSISDAIGTEMLNSKPSGIFVIVVLEMKNVGSETIDLSSRPFQLIDEKGRKFDADTKAMTYAVNDDRIHADTITYEQVQPGLSMKRSVIFDVPKGQAYGLLVKPAGMFSAAETHLVLIRST